MPYGLIISKLLDNNDLNILKIYPLQLNFQKDYLLDLYKSFLHNRNSNFQTQYFHEQGFCINSIFTNGNFKYFFTLILDIEEDPEEYEPILCLVAIDYILMQNNQNDNLNFILNDSNIESVFKFIKNFPKLKIEVKYSLILLSNIFQTTLNIFREKGVLTRDQIEKELNTNIPSIKNCIDVNLIIKVLIYFQILREEILEGMKIPTYFLIKDLVPCRIPAIKIYEESSLRNVPTEFEGILKNSIKDFFTNYKIDENDNISILKNIILNKEVYECFKVLRIACIKKEELEELQYKGVYNIDECLNVLLNHKMIISHKDNKKNEYFSLISDFQIIEFFPEYLYNKYIEQYKNKTINEFILMRAIEILKEELVKWIYKENF